MSAGEHRAVKLPVAAGLLATNQRRRVCIEEEGYLAALSRKCSGGGFVVGRTIPRKSGFYGRRKGC